MAVSQQLKDIINGIAEDFADPAADFQAVRATMAPFHGHPTSDALTVAEVDYGGVRCGEYSLAGASNKLLAFHCHGGALVSCPLDDYHFYAELIATHTGARVVMPDYRLAPEHLFPAAFDDCFNAYRGLIESGVDPATIVVMGESCGGSLAVALLVRARAEGLPMPLCFVSITGWFDLSVAGPAFTERDPFLTAEWVRQRGRDYTGDTIALDDPRVSPAYADLTGLAPMYLQVGQFDTVREGAITLAARALRQGVAVTMESWPGVVHGWHGLANAGVPEAIDAWRGVREYIERLARG